jgi:predicted TIM-barrel fold metal-dependent hydrolase
LKKLPDVIFDFHVHLFPDRLFDAIWRTFRENYRWDVLHHLYYKQCIEYLRQRNVGPVAYSNYAHKRDIARGLNRWNREVVDEIPELYCFGAYHPDDDDAVQMAEEFLDQDNVLGFKLQLLVQRFYPHDERLFPLYDMVIEKGKRILFHVGTGPVGNEFVGVSHFKRLLKRYPELPANVAHMGALEYREFMELLDEYPNIYLDTSFTFFPDTPFSFDLDAGYLERYKDRIVYGSDFPNLMFPREVEIDHLLNLDLSQEFYDRVFLENGMHILERCI